MVTPTRHLQKWPCSGGGQTGKLSGTPGRKQTPFGSVLMVFAGMALGMLCSVQQAWGVELQLVTLKRTQHTSPNSPLLKRMEARYGRRITALKAGGHTFEYELLARTPKGRGIGFGIEFFSETNRLRFGNNLADTHTMDVEYRGVMFLMKTFFRYKTWLPFLAVGLGNYYVEFRERNFPPVGAFSAENVWQAKLGLRWIPGRVAWLAEVGWVNVNLTVPSSVGTHHFDAGGVTQSLGVSWAF